jgi:hypothetical protein
LAPQACCQDGRLANRGVLLCNTLSDEVLDNDNTLALYLTGATRLEEYTDRLSKAGKSARIIEYPDVYHFFDASAFKTAIRNEQRVIEEGENGVILNSETRQPFSPSDPCVEKRDLRAHTSKKRRRINPTKTSRPS